MAKEFKDAAEFWNKAKIGDTLAPGAIMKCSILFPRIEVKNGNNQPANK